MRYLLLIFLMCFAFAEHTEAQSTEFLIDGLNWSYRGRYIHDGYKIDSSKTVNGKNYKLLNLLRGGYDSRAENPMLYSSSSVDYDYYWVTIGIREENGRIYVDKEEYLSLLKEEKGHYWIRGVDGENLPYETTDEGELVLYDFTKKEGEVYLQISDSITLTVTKTHTIKTEDGLTRRCLTLSNGYEIIEGVGSINSPGLLLFWLNMKPDYTDFGAMTNFWLQLADGKRMTILAQSYDAIERKRSGYPSIMQQGRRWVYDYDNGQMKGILTYSMEGDTLNQGYKGYKINMTLVDKESDQIVKSCYAGALFEKYETVTFLAPGKTNDKTLYSFDNLSRIRPEGYSVIVVNFDDIIVGDVKRRRVLMVNKRDSVPLEKDSLYYWVEGIGSSRGLLEYNAGALSDSIKFVACYDGEKCIFTNEDFTKGNDLLSKYAGAIDIGELSYRINMATETASVSCYKQSRDSLVIPSSVDVWGKECNVVEVNSFYNCTNLKSIILPQSIVSIGESAFEGCTGLTEMVIPDSVRTIGNRTFRICSGLVTVHFPKNLSAIGQGAFQGCTNLQSVSLPEGLETIGSNSFTRCTSMREVDLPATLKKIGVDAFGWCENLKDVYCRATTPPNFEDYDITFDYVFRNISPEATLHVPNDALQAYKNTNTWWKFKYIVPIEETNGILPHKYGECQQKIFDLQGRLVKGSPKRGIYVRDKRKVIW